MEPYAKELLFSAVVKAYGLGRAEAIFQALSLEEHAQLARALQGSFPALLVKATQQAGQHVLTFQEGRATYEELWVREGEGLEMVLPLVRPFLSFTGFIYLNLPEELRPLGRAIEEELRMRL